MYTLPDVKKFVRDVKKYNDFGIIRIEVSNEEFGEGFNTYVDIWYLDESSNQKIEVFTLGEEEKKSTAVIRAKRIAESLNKMTGKTKYEGITTW